VAAVATETRQGRLRSRRSRPGKRRDSLGLVAAIANLSLPIKDSPTIRRQATSTTTRGATVTITAIEMKGIVVAGVVEVEAVGAGGTGRGRGRRTRASGTAGTTRRVLLKRETISSIGQRPSKAAKTTLPSVATATTPTKITTTRTGSPTITLLAGKTITIATTIAAMATGETGEGTIEATTITTTIGAITRTGNTAIITVAIISSQAPSPKRPTLKKCKNLRPPITSSSPLPLPPPPPSPLALPLPLPRWSRSSSWCRRDGGAGRSQASTSWAVASASPSGP
jgi:hypothetical protein